MTCFKAPSLADVGKELFRKSFIFHNPQTFDILKDESIHKVLI
jgi:hypothetical protein